VWTSTRLQSKATAQHLTRFHVRQQPLLAELNPGEATNLTEEQIKAKYASEYEQQQQDPYSYRFPRGESYHDLALRLEKVIMELEHERKYVMIIAHESVLKCIYAYYFGTPQQEIPTLCLSPSQIIEITPSAYGCLQRSIQVPLV